MVANVSTSRIGNKTAGQNKTNAATVSAAVRVVLA
jgi:hypothetical protein